MARRALQVDAEKGLADRLGVLHRGDLRGGNISAPFDAVRETLVLRRRRDQLAHELVVGHVVVNRLIEPAADLLATASDEARAAIVVAQQIIPEGQPVYGIVIFAI